MSACLADLWVAAEQSIVTVQEAYALARAAAARDVYASKTRPDFLAALELLSVVLTAGDKIAAAEAELRVARCSASGNPDLALEGIARVKSLIAQIAMFAADTDLPQ